jgi:hypothetical protein
LIPYENIFYDVYNGIEFVMYISMIIGLIHQNGGLIGGRMLINEVKGEENMYKESLDNMM